MIRSPSFIGEEFRVFSSSCFQVWFNSFKRWGRVGMKGQCKLESFGTLADAKHSFCSMFLSKTGNEWGQPFQIRPGKYVLIEVEKNQLDKSIPPVAAPKEEDVELDFEAEVICPSKDGKAKTSAIVTASPAKVVPSSGLVAVASASAPLDDSVSCLVKLIFDRKTMERLLNSLSFNLEKSPLGKLEKVALVKGLAALKSIEAAIEKGVPNSELEKLSSAYYSLIPHNFGMSRPTTIRLASDLQKEMELVAALSEIDVAVSLMGNDQTSPAQLYEKVCLLSIFFFKKKKKTSLS